MLALWHFSTTMVRMGSRPLTVDVLANTALYLRGKAASTKRAIVLPHFDLIKIVNNIPGWYTINKLVGTACKQNP